jgi:predicted component of type VI protein secretion system
MSSLRLVPVSGQPIDVLKDKSAVGRDPSCEIVVTDGSVSRRHALLEKRSNAWWVVDQGSANGTYVNSLKVAEQALRNGQELRFGALAFRVDVIEDPEATVATPILSPDDSATVVAAPMPPPMPPPHATPAAATPPPLPKAAPPTPPRPAAPPSAAAAADRFRPAGAPAAPASSGQMPAGAPPAKKKRGPLVWILGGCCGCLLLGALLAGVIGWGVVRTTKPAADAAHGWVATARQDPDAAREALSSEYRARVSDEEYAAITAVVQRSTDATFMSRSVDNDRAVMKGVLTGGPAPTPVTIDLVKEDGAWKVNDVRLGVE